MIELEINGKDYFLAESLHEITVNDGIRLEAWQLENKPKGDDEIQGSGHHSYVSFQASPTGALSYLSKDRTVRRYDRPRQHSSWTTHAPEVGDY